MFKSTVVVLALTALITTSAYSQAVKTGYAPVNGLKLYYEIHGAGEPLVLLHGGLGAIDMFGSNIAELAKVRQVIALDLQGHGRTGDIDRPLRIEYMADDVAGLLKHLNIPKADIMGYSMGGGVALQTAIRHPGVVNKLVVISTPIRRSAFYADILAQQKMVNAAAAEFMKGTPMYDTYMRLAPRKEDFPKLLTKIGEMMAVDSDWTKDVANINASVLLIAADADMFKTSHAVEMYELLGGGQRDGGWDGAGRPKNVQLAILPGLTHYNIFMSPALLPTVLPFLNPGATPKW